MGTFRAPRLSDDEICSRYAGGEGRTMIALRAKMPDSYIREVLQHYGIPLRDRAEARALFAPIATAQRRRQRQRRQGQC